MNQDKEKLLMILHNLEEDYNAGNISEEKYVYLASQYKHKIKTIDVTERIRSMQGKPQPKSLYPQQEPITEDNQRVKAKMENQSLYASESNSDFENLEDLDKKSREEDERLVQKFVYNPESSKNKYFDKNGVVEEESKSDHKLAFGILATLLLLVAFGAGISFGVFNFEGQSPADALVGVSASINDTAFPTVQSNDTKKNITTVSNTKTYSVKSSDADYSSSLSSDSSSSSSSSNHSSDSSGLSSINSSSSNGYDGSTGDGNSRGNGSEGG